LSKIGEKKSVNVYEKEFRIENSSQRYKKKRATYDSTPLLLHI
jgi:hypothetical protein